MKMYTYSSSQVYTSLDNIVFHSKPQQEQWESDLESALLCLFIWKTFFFAFLDERSL